MQINYSFIANCYIFSLRLIYGNIKLTYYIKLTYFNNTGHICCSKCASFCWGTRFKGIVHGLIWLHMKHSCYLFECFCFKNVPIFVVGSWWILTANHCCVQTWLSKRQKSKDGENLGDSGQSKSGWTEGLRITPWKNYHIEVS